MVKTTEVSLTVCQQMKMQWAASEGIAVTGDVFAQLQSQVMGTLQKRPFCVLENMPPQRSHFEVAANIPDCEGDIFIFYRLHMETLLTTIS